MSASDEDLDCAFWKVCVVVRVRRKVEGAARRWVGNRRRVSMLAGIRDYSGVLDGDNGGKGVWLKCDEGLAIDEALLQANCD
jgi:hypothetical protein